MALHIHHTKRLVEISPLSSIISIQTGYPLCFALELAIRIAHRVSPNRTLIVSIAD